MNARKAILVIGHGSRDNEGNAQFLDFAEQAGKNSPAPIFETAFLELASPGIAEGIERCVSRGASEVTVVPMMLFPASHVKKDIPEQIESARFKYPAVKFRYAPHLGIHPGIFEVLEERIAPFVRERDQSGVLLVGRGTSDDKANADFLKICRLFKEKSGVRYVEAAYSGVAAPSFEEGLARCARLDARSVVVVPYFLFTGVLIRKMKETVAGFQSAHPGIRFAFAGHLGWHPKMTDVFWERAAQAVEFSSVLSVYRSVQ